MNNWGEGEMGVSEKLVFSWDGSMVVVGKELSLKHCKWRAQGSKESETNFESFVLLLLPLTWIDTSHDTQHGLVEKDVFLL